MVLHKIRRIKSWSFCLIPGNQPHSWNKTSLQCLQMLQDQRMSIANEYERKELSKRVHVSRASSPRNVGQQELFSPGNSSIGVYVLIVWYERCKLTYGFEIPWTLRLDYFLFKKAIFLRIYLCKVDREIRQIKITTFFANFFCCTRVMLHSYTI